MMNTRVTVASTIIALLILAPLPIPAQAGEVPSERDLGLVQILKETAVPHPYAENLRKAVLATMKDGSLWGKYRDVEDGRRYVGWDACRPCHFDRVETWARTKMATAIKKLADFKGGLFLNDLRCLSCHTTGYDPGRDNGGFDEGEGLMAGVQCEACHGAGSLMVEKTDRRYAIRTPDADLCGRCHSERYGSGLCFPEYDEWRTSRHRASLETLKQSPGAKDECLECHSADASVPPSDRRLTLQTASFGVTCEACHNAMERTFPDLPDNNQLRRPKKELCQWCHSTRRQGPDSMPHAPQAEMFAGTGGAQFAGEGYRNSPMNADIERGCLPATPSAIAPSPGLTRVTPSCRISLPAAGATRTSPLSTARARRRLSGSSSSSWRRASRPTGGIKAARTTAWPSGISTSSRRTGVSACTTPITPASS
jgi:hypothetical protein